MDEASDGAASKVRNSPRVIIPLLLTPGFASASVTMSPLPGLHVQPLAPDDAKVGKERLRLPFLPNCIISVDADEYEEGARLRLESIGHYRSQKMPSVKPDDGDGDPSIFVSGASIAKWILTSLVLTRPFGFVFGPVLRFRGFHGAETDVERIELRSGTWKELTGIQRYRFAGMPQPDLTKPFVEHDFRLIVYKLESYFRPTSFRFDRLAVALTSLWSSLCTEFPDQAYVSLSVVVESLLSTQETEITHQLAERVASLLARPDVSAVEMYRKVKRLYAVRSNIVHGRGMSERDQSRVRRLSQQRTVAISSDYPLHMHPLSTSVPMEDLRELTDICIRLIRVFILHDDVLGLIQSHSDEKLNDFFVDLLLGYEVTEDVQAPRHASDEGSVPPVDAALVAEDSGNVGKKPTV